MKRSEFFSRIAVLRRLHDRYAEALQTGSAALEEAALLPFMRLLQEGITLEDFLVEIQEGFHLPAREMERLGAIYRDAYLRLSSHRSQLYIDTGDLLSPVNIPALRLDFPPVQSRVMAMIADRVRAIEQRGGTIADLYTSLRASGYVAHQSYTLTNTAMTLSSIAQTHAIAIEAGLDRYEYYGPPGERRFCQTLLSRGGSYTRAQISAMDNGQGLPVLTSGGGYNCRHEWLLLPSSFLGIKREIVS